MTHKHPFSYPRSLRLHDHAHFCACYARARKYHTLNFIVFVLTEGCQGTDGARTGVSVSKKVGNAAVRNRLKRVLREFFRLWLHPRGVRADIVVVVKKHAQRSPDSLSSLTLRTAADELTPLFERLFPA